MRKGEEIIMNEKERQIERLSFFDIENVIDCEDDFFIDTDVDTIDIVQIPFQNVNSDSELEEFVDENINDNYRTEIPAIFEVHTNIEFQQFLPSTPIKVISNCTIVTPEPNWIKTEPIYSTIYTKTNSCELNLNRIKLELKELTPVQMFEQFFDESIMELIVNESINYAIQNNRGDSFKFSINCLKKFIGMLLFTGICGVPEEHLYWDERLQCQLIGDCNLTRNRFSEIKNNLHFNDNLNIQPNESDKFYKIRPLITKLNKNFLKYGIFSKQLTIDEQMVRYNGEYKLKGYIRGKHVRFGIKQWIMACSESGYCYKMNGYEGNLCGKKEQLQTIGENVLIDMITDIKNPHDHEIYVDNFFATHHLMNILKQKGIKCTGTVRFDRTGDCPIKTKHELKMETPGSYDYCFDVNNEILCVMWRNKRVISNHQTLTPLTNIKITCKEEKRTIEIGKPHLITEHNKYINGVNKLDFNVQKYHIRIRSRKWYFPIFTNAIDVAVFNAFLLYNKVNQKISMNKFRETIFIHYLKNL